MKKINVLLMICAILMTLTACGGSSLEGHWEVPGGVNESSTKIQELAFYDDGTYTSNNSNYNGEYTVSGSTLKLTGILVEPKTLNFIVSGDTLSFFDDEGNITIELERTK